MPPKTNRNSNRKGMGKFIKIDVDSASVIVDEINGKNWLPTELGRSLRTDGDSLPFGPQHISNMLHVFIGERPVSSFRPSIDKRLGYIDRMAENAYYQIHNAYRFQYRNGGYGLFTSTMRAMKNGSLLCSFNKKKAATITFDGLYANFIDRYGIDKGREQYRLLLELVSRHTSREVNEKNYNTVDEAFKDLYDTGKFNDYKDAYNSKPRPCKMEMLKNDLEANGFSVSLINGTNGRVSTATSKLGILDAQTYTMVRKVTINVSFIFHVDNGTCERILNGKKAATFLDGGSATLGRMTDFGSDSYYVGELDEYDITYLGYKKFSEQTKQNSYGHKNTVREDD